MRQPVCLFLIAAWAALLPSLAFGITAGQVADFSNDDVQGWVNGGGGKPLPEIIASGGPTGEANPDPNPYLLVSSGFVNDTLYAPNLVTLNRGTTWIGDYVTPLITSIDMDFKNFSPGDAGSVTLPMRIAFLTVPGDNPGYISQSIAVPNDGAWHHVSFSLSSTNMLPYLSPPPLTQVLSNAGGTNLSEIRILAASSVTMFGDSGNFQIGIDNITAVSTPILGDWDRNGVVNSSDVPAMFAGLTDLNAYKIAKGLNDTGLAAVGDFTQDGSVTNLDIQPLLDLVGQSGQGGISAVPESASIISAVWALAAIGLVVLQRRFGGRNGSAARAA